MGGSPAGASTGGTVFVRAAYAILPWFGAALEAGWTGVPSDHVDGLLHVIPLRLGVDFGLTVSLLHAAVGARFVLDVWTAEGARRETGTRAGGGLFTTVVLFPWENFGFGIAAALDMFPLAVQLDVGDDAAYALGWVRFLFSGGIVGRM